MSQRDSHGRGTQGLFHSPCVPSVPQMARTRRDKCPVCPACPADEGRKGHEGHLSGLSRMSRTNSNTIERKIAVPIKPARADLARATEAARARALLETIRPLKAWVAETNPSAFDVLLASAVVAEAIRLADFAPEEAQAVAAVLELHEAVAITEGKNRVH